MSERTLEDTHSVRLPADVTDRIEDRLDRTRFDTVDEYAAEALELLLSEVTDGERSIDRSEDRSTDRSDDGAIDDADEVEDRLESLGYL